MVFVLVVLTMMLVASGVVALTRRAVAAGVVFMAVAMLALTGGRVQRPGVSPHRMGSETPGRCLRQ